MSEIEQEEQSTQDVVLPIREAHMSYLDATRAAELDDDWTEEEELEWDTLFAQPHVQAGLDRLAKEAERQIAAGEIEEGGFAVE
jgi:hypothetical protein